MSKSKKITASKTPKAKAKPAAKRTKAKAKAVASLAGPTQEQAQAAAEVIGQAPENGPGRNPRPGGH